MENKITIKLPGGIDTNIGKAGVVVFGFTPANGTANNLQTVAESGNGSGAVFNVVVTDGAVNTILKVNNSGVSGLNMTGSGYKIGERVRILVPADSVINGSNTDGYIVFTVQRFQVVGNANEEVLDLTQGSFLTCSLVEGKNNEIKLTYLRPDIERNYKIEIAPSASNDKERTQVVRQLNKILLEAGQNPNSKIKIGPVLAGIPTMPNATFKSVEVVGAL